MHRSALPGSTHYDPLRLPRPPEVLPGGASAEVHAGACRAYACCARRDLVRRQDLEPLVQRAGRSYHSSVLLFQQPAVAPCPCPLTPCALVCLLGLLACGGAIPEITPGCREPPHTHPPSHSPTNMQKKQRGLELLDRLAPRYDGGRGQGVLRLPCTRRAAPGTVPRSCGGVGCLFCVSNFRPVVSTPLETPAAASHHPQVEVPCRRFSPSRSSWPVPVPALRRPAAAGELFAANGSRGRKIRFSWGLSGTSDAP